MTEYHIFKILFRNLVTDLIPEPPKYPLSDKAFYICIFLLTISTVWNAISYGIIGLRIHRNGFVLGKDIIATLVNTWNIYCTAALFMLGVFYFEGLPFLTLTVCTMPIIGLVAVPLLLAYYNRDDYAKYETMRFPIDFYVSTEKKET